MEEKDIDIRYALVKGIGYDRIKEELAVEIIDTVEGYGLLRLPIQDSFEFKPEDCDLPPSPIQIFKMPHPKTNKNLTLRVPSDVNSIKKAIGWVANAFDF